MGVALDEHEANWCASHRLTTDNLLLGKLYQDEVFQKLRCGTEYMAVRLGGAETEEIKFKAESYKLFSSCIDDVAPNILYVPVESNKEYRFCYAPTALSVYTVKESSSFGKWNYKYFTSIQVDRVEVVFVSLTSTLVTSETKPLLVS